MANILRCTSANVMQVVESVVERPVIVVIADLRFDPDLGDDLAEYHELHELECLFVQMKAKEAVQQLARFGLTSKLVPFIEGVTSLDGRRLDRLFPPCLDLSDNDVVVVAPVVRSTSDEKSYIQAATSFGDLLLNLFEAQARGDEASTDGRLVHSR